MEGEKVFRRKQKNYLGVKVPRRKICNGCNAKVFYGKVIYGHCWNCNRCPPTHTREYLMPTPEPMPSMEIEGEDNLSKGQALGFWEAMDKLS